MLSASVTRMTYSDYLALEASSSTKHEYLNGRLYAQYTQIRKATVLRAEIVKLEPPPACTG